MLPWAGSSILGWFLKLGAQMKNESADILLRREDGWWVAEWCGAEGDRVFDLFGTRVLPTSYGAVQPARRVLEDIRALNPGRSVEIHA